ncbi:hypothetical protein D3C76_1045990 [compost metagenome]
MRQGEAGSRVVGEHGEADTQLFGRLAQLGIAQPVVVDSNHAHPLALALPGQEIQLGNLGAAGSAPVRPVVDHQPLAVQAFRRDLLAVLVDAVILGTTGQEQTGEQSSEYPKPHSHTSSLLMFGLSTRRPGEPGITEAPPAATAGRVLLRVTRKEESAAGNLSGEGAVLPRTAAGNPADSGDQPT